jgi:hypothetical protein
VKVICPNGDTDEIDFDLEAIMPDWISKIKPGNDFASDRAKVTKVLVRKDGVWIEVRIELKPFGPSNK